MKISFRSNAVVGECLSIQLAVVYMISNHRRWKFVNLLVCAILGAELARGKIRL